MKEHTYDLFKITAERATLLSILVTAATQATNSTDKLFEKIMEITVNNEDERRFVIFLFGIFHSQQTLLHNPKKMIKMLMNRLLGFD